MKRFGAEASAADSPGSAMAGSPIDGCPLPASCIPAPACASLPGPKAGARCGSSARRDLSGGPPARAVPTGLSWEALVMRVEPRGRLSMEGSCGQPASGREESCEPTEVDRQAVCDLQAGGGGSVREGKSQPGRTWGGWVHGRGVRVRSAKQVVCDVESDVLGVVFSTSGAGGGDTKTARRGDADARGADRGGPGCPDGGSQGAGEGGGAEVPRGLLWVSAGPLAAARGCRMPAALFHTPVGVGL